MMLSRWLLSRRTKRKRTLASSATDACRIEMLEPRTCMANDLTASNLFVPLATPGYDEPFHQPTLAPSNAVPDFSVSDCCGTASSAVDTGLTGPYSVSPYAGDYSIDFSVRSWRLDDEICLIPPTVEVFSLEIELCIDPSVGPRPSPGLASLAYGDRSIDDSFRYAGSFLSSAYTQDLLDAPSLNADFGNARAKIADVPQRVGDDGEGEVPPTNSDTAIEPTAPVMVATKTSKHGEVVERHATTRKASFVAAIDDIHGSKTDAVSGLKVADSDKAIARESDDESAAALKRLGWSELLASKALRATSANDESPQDPECDAESELDDACSRPLLAALPGMNAKDDFAFEFPADADPTDARSIDMAQPATAVELLPVSLHPRLPVSTVSASIASDASDGTVPAVTVSEAAAWPLGILLQNKEDETQVPASESSRPSRYWYLAAIPAFFALPRRVRERTPSVPRLKPTR